MEFVRGIIINNKLFQNCKGHFLGVLNEPGKMLELKKMHKVTNNPIVKTRVCGSMGPRNLSIKDNKKKNHGLGQRRFRNKK